MVNVAELHGVAPIIVFLHVGPIVHTRALTSNGSSTDISNCSAIVLARQLLRSSYPKRPAWVGPYRARECV